MRIGIAAIGNLSEDTGGKNYIVQFVKMIEQMRPPHTFVLFVSDGEAAKLGIRENDHLKVVEIKNSSQTPIHKVIGEQLRLPKFIARERIDVMYHPGNFVSIFSDVPAAVNIRSMAHAYPHYGVSGVRRIVRSLLMPLSVKKAEAIITPSEDIKQDAIRIMNAEPERIHVIPHGVDLALFDGETNRAAQEGFPMLERFELYPNEYLLYVSALWRYKRQDRFLRAHAMLVKEGFPNLKLVLAGKGTGTDKKYLEEIHALPKILGTEDLVVFTGGLPQTDLRCLYAHAQAFVFPSSYESFGNPMFEAWASGIPVAVSNVHSFPEMAGDAALLFDPSDMDDMKQTITRLLSDTKLRQMLVEQGRQRAKEFTWERAISRTLSCLEDVYDAAR